MNTKLNFAILDPVIDTIESVPVERELRKGEYCLWGSDNKYPNMVLYAAKQSPTMSAIINSCVNYITGEGDVLNEMITYDLIKDVAESYAIFGGFALHVAKNNAGEISRVECLDMRFCRTDKNRTFITYNEDFANDSGYISTKKSIILPTQKDKSAQEYIYLYTNSKYNIYPVPEWASSLKSTMIEIGIIDYHFNGLKNGLNDTVIFNFLSGVPEDEEKKEIERAIDDKFCGTENAGRPIINYGNGAEEKLEVDTISTSNWADKYIALTENTKEKQYASWRMAPSLCGIVERGTGFSSTEYAEEYALFFANVIRPIQKRIELVLSEIFDVKCEITPIEVKFPETI